MVYVLVALIGVFVGINIALVLSGWAERRVRNDVARYQVIAEAEQVLRDAQ